MEVSPDKNNRDQIVANLENALREIQVSEIELRAIMDSLPAHAWCSRGDGYNIFCNQQWLDYSGFTQETALGWSYRDNIHPDDVGPYVKKWDEVSTMGTIIEAEARLRRFDGEYRWFLIRAVPVRDENGEIIRWFGTNTDIDERKKAEALLAGENKILEMVATGRPLEETLEELCRIVDDLSTDSMASVLLVDPAGCLRRGASPRFPQEFIAFVDGIKIGPAVGSCGTAAWRKEQVIVSDIEADPLWDEYRELARLYGFRAGWSTPILASDRSVLGVFGIYWDKPRSPSHLHLHVIAHMTHLASVAIERKRSRDAVRASEIFARGQADTLTRTLDKIAQESAMDRIAEHVLRALTNQLGATSSSVWLRNGATGHMDFEFALEEGQLKSKADPTLASVSASLPIGAIPAWAEAFNSGKPVVLPGIREGLDFPWRSHVLGQGIITILVVPMFVSGGPSGVIGLRFNQRRAFQAGEIELAQALANQAMLAMQLTRLSEKSRQSAVMEERNRMAREVHDTLAQGFTGIVVQLEAAEEAISQGQKAKVSSHLERAGELARESLQEARRSVQALRPRALEANSLGTALADLMAKMTSGTLVEAKLSVEGDARELPSEWENNLLRIGQEVLTNALRHACPTEFQARLLFTPHEVGLCLRDNGCGFDPTEHHEGFGLQGIRERTEKMGGKFSIRSTKGAGTSISILLPTTEIPPA